MKYKAQVSKGKKKSVDEFSKLLDTYPIVGIVDMENLPSKQLQSIRGKLRDSVLIRLTKKRLLKLAIDKAKEKKKGIEKLMEYGVFS